MNDHIHLLEAYAELLREWPDPEPARKRTEETPDVRPRPPRGRARLLSSAPPCRRSRSVPAPVSFGHDVETGFLMIEAEQALGRKPSPATLRAARMLVDHALASGFDATLADRCSNRAAPTDRPSCVRRRVVAVRDGERLLPHARPVRHETDAYCVAASRRHGASRVTMLDRRARCPGVRPGLDETRRGCCRLKSHDWFVSYHTTRALILTANRLRQQPER